MRGLCPQNPGKGSSDNKTVGYLDGNVTSRFTSKNFYFCIMKHPTFSPNIHLFEAVSKNSPDTSSRFFVRIITNVNEPLTSEIGLFEQERYAIHAYKYTYQFAIKPTTTQVLRQWIERLGTMLERQRKYFIAQYCYPPHSHDRCIHTALKCQTLSRSRLSSFFSRKFAQKRTTQIHPERRRADCSRPLGTIFSADSKARCICS